MPREWGRDPFYTFLPRERNEGAGRVKAVSANVTYKIPKIRLKSSLGIGQYLLPSVMNYQLNKYAMPSYTQLNADVRHDFNGFLDGTNIQILYVYKFGTGNHYENPKNIVNKINMSNFNIVLNYKFEHHRALRKVGS